MYCETGSHNLLLNSLLAMLKLDTVANYMHVSKIKRFMMTLLKIVSCSNTQYRLIATKANLLLLVQYQYIDLLYEFEMMTL